MNLVSPRSAIEVGLRLWTPEDGDELVEVFCADRVALETDAPWRDSAWFTPRGQRERIERCLADPSVEAFVITRSGAIVGTLSLDQIRRDIMQSADVGYWVDPRHRRQGIATGAIGLALGHAFTTLRLHRVHATVDVDNRPSQRALEANAFHRVGVIQGFALIGGRWRDHHLYQRTAEASGPSRGGG